MQLDRPAAMGRHTHTAISAARHPDAPGARTPAHQDEPICREYLNRSVLSAPHQQLRRRHRNRAQARVARAREPAHHRTADRGRRGRARTAGGCGRGRFRRFRGRACLRRAVRGRGAAGCGFSAARGASSRGGARGRGRACRRSARLRGGATFATARQRRGRKQRNRRDHAKDAGATPHAKDAGAMPARARMWGIAHRMPTKGPEERQPSNLPNIDKAAARVPTSSESIESTGSWRALAPGATTLEAAQAAPRPCPPPHPRSARCPAPPHASAAQAC